MFVQSTGTSDTDTHIVGIHGPKQPQRLEGAPRLPAGVYGTRVAVAVGLQPLALHLVDQLARLLPLTPDKTEGQTGRFAQWRR